VWAQKPKKQWFDYVPSSAPPRAGRRVHSKCEWLSWLRISTWLDAAIPSQAATFFHRRAYDAALVARLITLGKT
jgi:hypothetical protein